MKIAVLLVVTLGAMRLLSWGVGWIAGRAFQSDRKAIRFFANVISLLLFAGFLVYDSVPGELLDVPALVFGIVTFSIFTLIDWWWWPWNKKQTVS